MKRTFLFVLLGFHFSATLAQTKTIDGIVFDGSTKERIAKVNIVNLTTPASVYDNLKAEFKIPAQKGDKIVFSKEGFFNDTIIVKDEATFAVYLQRTAIPLKPVFITGRFLTPQNQLELNKQLYSKAYGSLANHDLLSIGADGAGLSIDALYNMISRQGRNATRLRETIDKDYQQNVIDSRFNPVMVASITGLKDPQLTDFMFKYRPGYYFVIEASDYDFIKYIRNNARRYKRNPDAYALAPLYLTPDK
jgi:co-chaperonin GroES (HSP10)